MALRIITREHFSPLSGNSSTICLYASGQFVISRDVAEVLEIDVGDKISFALDDDERKAYISYSDCKGFRVTKNEKQKNFRFTSKMAKVEIEDFFEVNTWDNKLFFRVDLENPLIHDREKLFSFYPHQE